MSSLLKPPTLSKILAILEAPGWSDWMPGLIQGRRGSQVGQSGGEIMPAHIYRNEKKRWQGLLPCSDLFRLMAPPLQLVVIGSYPGYGVWFPSYLLLEETSRIKNFGP
jgi:hypothetical protein